MQIWNKSSAAKMSTRGTICDVYHLLVRLLWFKKNEFYNILLQLYKHPSTQIG